MTLNQTKIIVTLVVLILVGFIVERSFIRKTSPEPIANKVSFIHEGNLFKDTPGLKPGVWFLSYEEPGKPGLKAELNFTNQISDLQLGMRAHIEGYETNGVVEVNKLEILNAYKHDSIWVDTPRPNQTVINPITINGAAKGNWYFEATFPIKVLDANDKMLGQTTAEALSDWTSDDYVQFVASLNYTTPSTPTGTLVLEKDNPSGLPQNAEELRIPITFGIEGRAVKLYYYNPEKDKDVSGNILASRKGLVAVDRQIPITDTPIQDTIKLLLQGKLTEEEKKQGITTEYPLPGVELKSADLKNDILTLEFIDPQNKISGGSARVGILWFQIEETAKQYPGVFEVKFKPEELFQP